jgi:hypothetical protein
MHQARWFFFMCAGVFLLGTSAAAGPPPWPPNYLLGLITGQKTLTRASPGPFYYVVGDLTVAPGATLTIEPGCSLVIAASDTLQGGNDPTRVEFGIYGSLLCQGTAADTIRLTSAQPGGYWWGPHLYSGGSATLLFCSLRDCGFQSGSGATATLTDCTVASALQQNILGSASLTACCVQSEIWCSGTLTMTGCSVIVGGLHCSGRATVQRCTFTGPGEPVTYWSGQGDLWAPGDGSVGVESTQGGIVVLSDPSPTDPSPTVVRGYWKGVSGGSASNVVAVSCTYGFCDGCNSTYCTAYGGAFGFGDFLTPATAKNCIAAANLNAGFINCAVSYSDAWGNSTCPYGMGQFAMCTNMLMTASWNPFFVNAPSDLRLRPDSIFMGWSDTGCQIGAYGPGAGPPVAVHNTTWGRVKALYR